MAARGMNGGHRLCVLQFPSPTEPFWREAIGERARAMGWAIHDLNSDAQWPLHGIEGEAVIFATGAEGAEKLDPTDWVILIDTPTTSANIVGGALGEEPHSPDSLIHASARLATAAMVADREDVLLIDARCRSASFPGLGTVSRTDADLPRFDHDVTQPMSMFDRLPTAISTITHWTPDVFTYPKAGQPRGGQPDIDLTGRARTLVTGPFIHLQPGSWRVEIDVNIDPEQGKVGLLFQWGAGADYVACSATVTHAGQYRVSLDRDWDSLESAQVRISLPQPVFQGRMEFLGCHVTRTPKGTPPTTLPDTEAHGADDGTAAWGETAS